MAQWTEVEGGYIVTRGDKPSMTEEQWQELERVLAEKAKEFGVCLDN